MSFFVFRVHLRNFLSHAHPFASFVILPCNDSEILVREKETVYAETCGIESIYIEVNTRHIDVRKNGTCVELCNYGSDDYST